MRNIWLIAMREYTERIRTRGFMIATILIPLLMSAGIAGTILIAKHSKSNSHIAVVSNDMKLATDVQNELEHGKDSEMLVDVISPPSAKTRANLDAAVRGKDLDGYLWINPSKTAGGRPQLQYKQGASADLATRSTISHGLTNVLTRENLVRQGMNAEQVEEAMKPVDMETETGAKDSTAENFAAAYVTFFLMYMVIMLYGMNVARSIIEEKTSRVFEVMLATVKPVEMMAGKVLGVGSVGLTQVGIWMLAAVVLTHTALIASVMGSSGSQIAFTASQVGYFIVFFLLGYLLYSAMAAALGAMTNSEQELQQLNMFLVLPLAACMVMLPLILNSPNILASRILSMVPFFAPLLMYMRISVSPVPWYEIAGSIAILLATIYAILSVTSRIYRVGILMYGKKPNLPEILRWVKYSA